MLRHAETLRSQGEVVSLFLTVACGHLWWVQADTCPIGVRPNCTQAEAIGPIEACPWPGEDGVWWPQSSCTTVVLRQPPDTPATPSGPAGHHHAHAWHGSHCGTITASPLTHEPCSRENKSARNRLVSCHEQYTILQRIANTVPHSSPGVYPWPTTQLTWGVSWAHNKAVDNEG